MSLESLLSSYACKEVSPLDLYKSLFCIGDGYIQSKGEYREKGSSNFKGNPIVYFSEQANYKGQLKRNILLEDTFEEQLKEIQKYPSNLLNACTYYGKKKDKEHADRCFGLIFDIDDIDEITLNRFLFGATIKEGIYPTPNYIVLSKGGHGMHLYYLFEEPIRLFPKIKIQLKSLKHDMTRWIWNPLVSNNENIQYQSFDQSFMVAGTYETMSVWELKPEKWTVEELFELADIDFDKSELWIESNYTIEEAKEKFPQWYEKVILNKDYSKNYWICKRDLYDWWIRKILDPRKGASYGHRYWCIMMLVIYGVKCAIPYDEVKKDAYGLMQYMNLIKPEEPFTEADVKSALECYDVSFATFPIDDISKLSAIPIKKNKRNGRKRSAHIKTVNAMRKFRRDELGEDEYKNNGRPSKATIVQEWQEANPNGKPKDCIAETGLNKNTVYKWWNS